MEWYKNCDEAREETYWRQLQLLHEDDAIMSQYWNQIDNSIKLATFADARQQEVQVDREGLRSALLREDVGRRVREWHDRRWE